MADDFIPDDVKQFIADKIDSVAELEGLLLFRGNPETDWSIESLAQRLYTNQEQTENVVAHLYSLGFITVKEGEPQTYRFAPYLAARQMIDRVADVYAKFLVPVTNLIHSKPQSKVQQFADAFKLRSRREK